MSITGTTRLYGIMGYPVTHSLSPVMQTFAFRHHQLDCIYVPFPVAPHHLAQAVSGAMALGVCGFNVTIPHKEAIMPYLDDISAEARAIGAVNTVQVRDGRSVGYNTDGEGFLRPLRALGMAFPETSVCLLGAGGAARAVAMALLSAGCPQLTLSNRTQARAERLARDLQGHFPRAQLRVRSWSESAQVATASGLLINATSVGLQAAGDMLVPETALHPGQIVYDLVYRPLYTPLLQAARHRGATPVPGLEMLIGQGDVAFGIWTGLAFPVDAVRGLLQPFFETAQG
ncbi:MAG: shikimate dehydrogenase [Candidatus Tectimicrobiota bacterium]